MQSIKAIQLEGGWLRHVFFRTTCRMGTFLVFWRYVWTLNFFFFFYTNFFFFFNSTFIWVFNFRQIFEGKSYPRLTFGSIYIRKYTVYPCHKYCTIITKNTITVFIIEVYYIQIKSNYFLIISILFVKFPPVLCGRGWELTIEKS